MRMLQTSKQRCLSQENDNATIQNNSGPNYSKCAAPVMSNFSRIFFEGNILAYFLYRQNSAFVNERQIRINHNHQLADSMVPVSNVWCTKTKQQSSRHPGDQTTKPFEDLVTKTIFSTGHLKKIVKLTQRHPVVDTPFEKDMSKLETEIKG